MTDRILHQQQQHLIIPISDTDDSEEGMESQSKGRKRSHKSLMRHTHFQPWLRLAWGVHFVASISILAYGSNSNHGDKKYIPIRSDATDCWKGFVNVFAESSDEPDAVVCCTGSGTDQNWICQSPPFYLFLAGRLARFPDAWLLPLFPLFLRGVFELMRRIPTGPTTTNPHTKRRFFLYVTLIQFRGWVLYLLFDSIEDLFVSDAGSSCWYEDLLHSDYSSCQGRVTDFSDHVVLYFAQILPIALVEVLHAFVVPYWEQRPKENNAKRFLPLILVGWLLNLYAVTFLGAYKTSVFFHTGSEILMGYLVSLLVQVPLFLVQCTSLYPQTFDYFYGQTLS